MRIDAVSDSNFSYFTLENDKMTFQGYYKMPAPQTRFENCAAHNGSLIPIPGRDVMVQAWYQGGISVLDEIDDARTVHLDYLNAQGQPKYEWPPSFSLARAYVD